MIKLIAVGKIKDRFIQDGIDEYLKRLKPFCKIQIIEAKEYHYEEINKNLDLEGESILSYINNNDYVITLEIDGTLIGSIDFSQKIEKHYTYHKDPLCFVIGGSNGLSEKVKARSNFQLSLGRLTFPHQLTRLILCEQIYRAFAIINNLKYHK